ncbi:MAG TPA: efflux RND transporter periplasmic adaptor subunit [Thermoanaerobaculia bacterium]|jgi:HlyD family secretion protein|nr:efflux RND transporter periplasmic adaptor subunit [Thermoanaerobaculia bacterium]
MRRWLIRLLVVVILVAAGLALRATVFRPKPIEVQAQPVGRGRVEETVTNTRAGTVKARRRAQLAPEAGGRILSITHREGERVKAGEVLMRLDASLNEAQVTLSRRELQAMEAQREQSCLAVERSQRELARLSRLAKEGIVSTDALDQAQTATRTAEASCRSARAAVEQARAGVDLSSRRVQQSVIRAPFDGVVGDLSVEVGEWTTPSPPGMPIPPVMDILDPDSIYISAPMDEVDSSRIHAGQPVRVTVDAYPGRSFAGHVRRVAPFVLDVEEQNRTVEIEVDLDNPGDIRLLPGTSADVEVVLEVRPDVLRVPTPALLEGGRVLVVRKDGKTDKLEERKVRTGLRNWDWTEVLDGLAPGDLVVTSLDKPEIKAGAEVTVANPAGTKPSS